jgi:hypothetical protein
VRHIAKLTKFQLSRNLTISDTPISATRSIISENDNVNNNVNLRNSSVERNAILIPIKCMRPLRVTNSSIQQLNRVEVLVLRPLCEIPLGIEDIDNNWIIRPISPSAERKIQKISYLLALTLNVRRFLWNSARAQVRR